MFAEEAATWTSKRDEIATRLRSGAVRERPSLDGVLEPELTDIFIERDEEGLVAKIHTNEHAAALRPA
jgi:hypothetical protein